MMWCLICIYFVLQVIVHTRVIFLFNHVDNASCNTVSYVTHLYNFISSDIIMSELVLWGGF